MISTGMFSVPLDHMTDAEYALREVSADIAAVVRNLLDTDKKPKLLLIFI
jgi:hypothetical protein